MSKLLGIDGGYSRRAVARAFGLAHSFVNGIASGIYYGDSA